MNQANSKLAQEILKVIDAGTYRIGDRLPPERELAKLLNTNRNTLREALKVLQTMGIVEIIQGSGTYLRQEGPFAEDIFSVFVTLHKDDVYDMYVVKSILDFAAIDLIPAESIPACCEKLRACIESIHIESCSAEEFIEHDTRFHQIIREASGNKVLVRFCNECTESVYDERAVLLLSKERRRQSFFEHRAILNAFESGDKAFIKKVNAAHSKSVEDDIDHLNSDT